MSSRSSSGRSTRFPRDRSSTSAGRRGSARRGCEFEVDVPFGILVDALDEYLAAMDPAQIDRALGDAAADLGAVFPSLGQRADAGGRFRAHRAVAALLERP